MPGLTLSILLATAAGVGIVARQIPNSNLHSELGRLFGAIPASPRAGSAWLG